MERRKLTKADIDKVRDIEGFPIAKDEDIIALSDAPYYTACPNPFIEDFIKENGLPYDEATDDYHREPFAADVSEGKTDPIYMAHAYHTKVPYRAIMRYILNYTNPGDIVLDGFCGTGMTGVAANMCGVNDGLEYSFRAEMPGIKWGARKAIMSDLAPAATFIAHNYNTAVNLFDFRRKLDEILEQFDKEYGWIYETDHEEDMGFLSGISQKGTINYTIWSDALICPSCGTEFVFADQAVDFEKGKVNDTFSCPHCGARLKKRDCAKAKTVYIDTIIGETVEQAKQVPVLINYTYNGKRYQKKPDQQDLLVVEKINAMEIPYWVPVAKMPEGFNTEQPRKSHGLDYVHHFFTKRNLLALAYLYSHMDDNKLRFLFTSIVQRASKLFKWSKNQAGPLSGTLYVSSCIYETAIPALIKNKNKIFDGWKITNDNTIINTASTAELTNIPNNSIDYIFTDPPFGGNLNYSELSFIWESWLKVVENNKTEAIMNDVQHKGLAEYQSLMERCFIEYYRVLKPNHWMTVEFHNSQNAVWNSIQEALVKAGFVIADVRTLDKKQGSFKQVTTSTAVQQDLIISAYKPKESFFREFQLKAGTPETAWSFIAQHLSNLPVAVVKNHRIEIIVERQAYLLFDRMVAYHIMHGLPVPMDAADFYAGLDERYLKRDNMYFLPNQVNEYDTARIINDIEPIQFSLIVSNEKTAISWLYQQLDTPQTYAEIQPKFMQEIKTVDKFEAMPELAVLLEENFLQDDKGRWYVPDVTKEADVAKLREKNLLKEFEGYLAAKGKLKLFRAEAIRVGFAKLWKDKNYKLIVETAERLPEQVIQEDDKLLMYYDISLGRV